MKLNELRLENWVDFNNSNVQIKAIMKGYAAHEIDYSDEMEGSKPDFMGSGVYEPIPLTPEWLERLGFEFVIDGEYKKGNLIFRITKYQSGDIVTVFLNGNFINLVLHVHQLQNLYFALTGDELIVPQ